MKKILLSLLLICAMSLPFVSEAKGGGGRAGGGARSSVRSYSSTRSTSTTSRVSTPKTTTPKVTTPKVSTKPSATTAKVTTPKAKTVGGKTFSKKGSVVDSTYQPKFNGGYVPPAGSVVYYRESSMMDWLPFYLILNSQNAHRDAVVVEPAKDGQPAVEKVVKAEGTDTMYIINWIMSILLVGGLIALIVWFINKRTK